jgi:hypothetical protein
MRHRAFQFGISSLMWLVVVAAIHCWLFSLGSYGIIIAIVADKHILVAYLCWAARVDCPARVPSSQSARKVA